MTSLQFGRTGTTMHYSRAYRPRFYCAGTQSPAANRYVLYWQYNQEKDGLGEIKAFPKYWDYMQLLMPIGIGKTDANGYLQALKYAENLQLYTALKFTHNSVHGRICHQLNIHPRNRVTNRDQFQFKHTFKSMTAFTPNKAMAFMFLPMDIDDSLRLDIIDLVEFGKKFHQRLLWCGQVCRDGQKIDLPMHSLEWASRLKKCNAQLGRILNRYQDEFIPLLHDLLPISQTRNFLDIYSKYPQDKNRWPFYELNQMQSLLVECEQHVHHEFIKRIKDIEQDESNNVQHQAQSLMEMLERDELAHSQDIEYRYRIECEEKRQKALFHWSDRYIGSAFRESLQLLAKIPSELVGDALIQKVFNRYCQPLLRIATNSSPPRADTPLNNSFEQLIKFSMQLSPTVVANLPGPPSLLVATINSIGLYYSKRNFVSKIGRLRLNNLLRLIYIIVKLLNGNKAPESAAWEQLSKYMRRGKIQVNENTLVALIAKPIDQDAGKFVGFAYHGLMRLILLYTLAVRVTDKGSNPYKKWVGVVAGSANLAVSLEKSITKLLPTGANKLIVSLGFIGYIAEGLYVLMEAVDELKKDDSFATLLVVNGLLTIAAGIFYLFSASASLGVSIGMALALLGVVLSSISNFVYEKFRSKIQLWVFQLLDNIGDKFGEEQFVKSRLLDLYDISRRIEWRRMSWRALVPLYEAGYRVASTRSSIMKVDGTLNILCNYVDLSNFPAQFQIIDKAHSGKSWIQHVNNDELDAEVALLSLRHYFNYYFDLLYAYGGGEPKFATELLEWQNGAQLPRQYPAPVLPSI